IGTKGDCLRQQKVAYVSRRQTLHLHLRAESRQAACDLRPRLLTVTRSLALIVNDQDLYSVCARKQGHSIRYGPDGLARGVPTYEDAADPRCRAPWRKEDDWSAGTQYQGFREARRVGHLASALRAGNNHEVRVVRIHGHLTAPVRQRPPFRPRYSVTSHNVFEYCPVARFDALNLLVLLFNHFSNGRTAPKGFRRCVCLPSLPPHTRS